MKTTTTPEIHLNPIALAGFSSANSYDTHRPSYASDAVEHLLNSLGLADKPRSRILELAAGTGKFTELLACRNENFDIVAVEPHRDMLRVLSEKNFPAGAVVNVKEGNAVDIPVENEWADSLIVAQGFHWFANIEALREFSRVLRPKGTLGFIWNIEDYNQARDFACSTSWESSLRDLNWKYTTDSTPRYKDCRWRSIFDHEHTLPTGFVPLGEKLFRKQAWLPEKALWNRFCTLSNIANLDARDKSELKSQFDDILRNADISAENNSEFAVNFTCHVVWTARI